MDAFKTHEQVVNSYRSYLNSFINIADNRIKEEVKKSLEQKGFIPDPLIQFNPSFQKDISLKDLVENKKVNPELLSAFGSYNLYKHQIEAIENGINGNGFIVTSGTGSGKSLTFLATIFNSIFNYGSNKPKGIKAILVYPMNALINSQEEEIKKYEINYLKSFLPENSIDETNKTLDEIIKELQSKTEKRFPITYAKYTGQESGKYREGIESVESDIVLTNYMMLELIMTRQSESWFRSSIKKNLQYLVFDELHTYRGRQGADVSMLIRRIKGWCKNNLIFIGTSATMSSVGSPLEKKDKIRDVAKQIFGEAFSASQIISEHLKTCTKGIEFEKDKLRNAIEKGISKSDDENEFKNHPLTNWLELNIALKNNHGILERGKPRTINEIAVELQKATELNLSKIESTIIDLLKWAELLNEKNRIAKTNETYLPFRFHQFISQTSMVSVTLENRNERSITINSGRYIKDSTSGSDKVLFPVLFSRYSGIDFLCVEKDTDNRILKPRNPNDSFPTLKQKDAKGENLSESNFKYGYIVLDDGEDYWNDNPAFIAPLAWLKKNETEFLPFYCSASNKSVLIIG